MVAVRIVAVRRVAVVTKELAVAACAHTMRGAGGAFGVGLGGSGGGGLLCYSVLSHRAAQLEEEQQDPKSGQHDRPKKSAVSSMGSA